MIEVLELVRRLTKKIPDYSKSRRIRINLGPGYSKMVIVGLNDDVIFYQFATDRDTNDWSRWTPKGSSSYVWRVGGVEEEVGYTSETKPSIISSTSAVVISVHKMPVKGKKP